MPGCYELNIALHGADDDEALPGTVGVAHDITELRERERLLRRAQRAVEASGHAIYITDPDGIILYVNPAFERVTGYPSEEAIGEDPSILRASVTDDDHHEALWRNITAGEIWDEEIVNRRRDGERYHAVQTIAPITDESGEIEGYVAIQTDITEHKDRLQQLQVMDRVLRHNLHNALNVILGYADLIREATTGKPSEDAATILRKGEELLDLVDKQRSITKALSAEPTVEAVDLVALVGLIADDLREEHPEVQIELALPATAVCRADGEIEKAVRELVTNAIEHADQPSPTVRLTVERTDDSVELHVIDEGPVIPEMDREVVTGEERIEPLYHGSGLGLWLVAWIVRRSGGSLAFEENEPRGNVVTMRLEPAQEPT
ncbi:MAG: HAMP domain-containing sensor histidine kinase [Halobacteriales archaeon]|nr:HAMP domain-containing sensor histidine kinase [Halobacteriales archaeon]